MKKIFVGKINEGKLDADDRPGLREALKRFTGGWFKLEMSKEKGRTRKQNNALHLFFNLMADMLNESGLDQRKVLKPEIDIPWDHESVKEKLWRPVQIDVTHKESTTELNSQEDINKVYDVLNRHLAQRFPGIPHVPFPFECKACGGLSRHYKGCPDSYK